MRFTIALPLLGASLALLSAPLAIAQDEAPQESPPDQAPDNSSTAEPPPAPAGPPPAQPAGSPPAPPAGVSPTAPEAPATDGQWVYTDAYGWIWVPAGSVSTDDVDAQPYVYLYAPEVGWTWFLSPWGVGPFFVGPWVHAPYPYPRRLSTLRRRSRLSRTSGRRAGVRRAAPCRAAAGRAGCGEPAVHRATARSCRTARRGARLRRSAVRGPSGGRPPVRRSARVPCGADHLRAPLTTSAAPSAPRVPRGAGHGAATFVRWTHGGTRRWRTLRRRAPMTCKTIRQSPSHG